MTLPISPADRSKKAMSQVLQRLAEDTQAHVAVSMGVSESTINRIKTERMEECLLMLAHLGFKVVPASYTCVDKESYDFLVRSHTRVMEKAPQLIWEADQQ